MALTIRKFISNRSDFPTIKREVVLKRHSINLESEEVVMYTKVFYYDENNVDITHKFKANEPILSATNIKRTILYQQDGVTPQTEQLSIGGVLQFEEDGITPIMVNKTIGLFDYLIAMLSVSVILHNLYDQYIMINDYNGNFNKAEIE